MLERQIMFKQLQKLQKQKKLQELTDSPQQNVKHNKHSSVTQYGLVNNGVQVRNASQMFMFRDTRLVLGLPNKMVHSRAQTGHLTRFQKPVLSQGLQIGSQSQTRKTQKVNKQGRYKEFGGVEESGMGLVSRNQDLATNLDPLEQRILFEKTDNNLRDCGSLQNASWSALMQTAVAEVSNGDSGVQEEWSGLSFQNPELSNEKQSTSNMVESGKHQIQWLYNSSGFMDTSPVSVKKELDGEKWSTFEVKPGICVDTNRKMKSCFGEGSGKMHPRGNHGPAVSKDNLKASRRSLKKATVNHDSRVKKERVDYDNKVPQVPNLVVKACIDQRGTNLAALTRSSNIYMKQYDVAKENMVVLESKKRKVSTFEHCSRLHDTSTAELEWAHSVNRIPEKAADSLGIVDRKRRRLISTTQLMQLLFRPSPKVVFSEDAAKNCDTITYYVAKFGLSDACSRPSRSIGDQDLLKVVEGFIDRSKRLEHMLSRFEKGESSILDVKVEFQELDKFSIINRFAKFHSRGPVVTSDTSSSGGASLNPERYVTANEMPSIVPQGQSCLLL